jgi:hypothetical protein
MGCSYRYGAAPKSGRERQLLYPMAGAGYTCRIALSCAAEFNDGAIIDDLSR